MADAVITIGEARPRSIAGIGAFRDRTGLMDALREALGVDVPVKSHYVQADGVALSCLAPGRFLASGGREADLPGKLARSLAGLAAVTDQSDMWAIFEVSGTSVREVLARVVPIDLGEDQFRRGDVAVTRAGHLDVRLWRVGERSYELATTRSFGIDLHHMLHQ